MLPTLVNYSTVIALIANEKHYSKKMLRLSFGDVMMKSVPVQVQIIPQAVINGVRAEL